jgi:hypothetical protein
MSGDGIALICIFGILGIIFIFVIAAWFGN